MLWIGADDSQVKRNNAKLRCFDNIPRYLIKDQLKAVLHLKKRFTVEMLYL